MNSNIVLITIILIIIFVTLHTMAASPKDVNIVDVDGVESGGLRFGEVLRVGNTKAPTALVLVAHGLGDSGRGWEDTARRLSTALPHVVFVLPTAPTIPLTISGGMPTNAWFDVIARASPTAPQDPNILKSATYLSSLALSEAAAFNIPSHRIVLGGFSQGAGVALAAALTGPFTPGGVVMMSGFFAGFRHVIPKYVAGRTMPVLICHGTEDSMLDVSLAEFCREKLMELGIHDIDFKTYAMGHSVHPSEIRDVVAFIGSKVGSENA